MKGEIQGELRSLLLFLCMDKLCHDFEVGLEAHFDEKEIGDINKLYQCLRDEVIDNIRATAVGHRLARERIEQEEKKALERQIPPGE